MKILLALPAILLSQVIYSQQFAVNIEYPTSTAYIGLQNRITCAVEKTPCSNVKLETTNGTIEKKACGEFIYKPAEIANSSITVLSGKGNSWKKIGDFQIYVREIPNPIAAIGGITDGKITKGNLKHQPGVSAYIAPYIGICGSYPVTAFQLSIFRNDSIIFSTKNDGNIFSDVIKVEFGKLISGDIVLFSNIHYMTFEMKIASVKPVELIIE